MIQEILAASHRLNRWLQDTLGEPYRTVLGIGLLVEIGKSLRDFPALFHSGKGAVGETLSLVLFVVLFIDQLAGFHERMAARRERRAGRRH
jgi:hypothetical protein